MKFKKQKDKYETYCVLGKPFNVSFIACVEENWPSIFLPVGCVDQISLRVEILIGKAKVVHLEKQ